MEIAIRPTMSENKTKPTATAVHAFLDTIENETRRNDGYLLLDLFQKITGQAPVMWGASLVGFGSYHYKYDTGREGDMLMAGFSPRKSNLAFYNTGFIRYPEIMARLGKHKTGKSCLYINKLADVNLDVLSELLTAAYEHMKNKHNS